MQAPTSPHWIPAKRVLRYLRGSIDHGLVYAKGNLHLVAYCDSNWAGSTNDKFS
jgi:hypothetical protein